MHGATIKILLEDDSTGSKHAGGRTNWFVTNLFCIAVGFQSIVSLLNLFKLGEKNGEAGVIVTH